MSSPVPSPVEPAAGGARPSWWAELRNPHQSVGRYLLRAWLADVPLTLVIVLCVGWITSSPWPDFEGFSLPRVLFAMVLFAPVGETFLMAGLFRILSVFSKSDHVRVVASAVIWAVLHSVASPAWGLQIFWAFFIFSRCYVTWEKVSIWRAIGITATLHGLHNAVPAAVLIVSRLTP